VGFLAIIFVLLSCNKYAEKVDGTYIGQITINDSTISSNANIIISEISNKTVSVESSFFDTYELEIEKQRYFGSVTYYNQGDSGTTLEIGGTATGLSLIFIYSDSLNNNYVFYGESD
jgi:hypothetical protein